MNRTVKHFKYIIMNSTFAFRMCSAPKREKKSQVKESSKFEPLTFVQKVKKKITALSHVAKQIYAL